MPSRIEGGDRLQLAFRVLPRNLRRKINRSAVAAGAKVGVKAVRRAAPRGATGRLAGSITSSRDRRTRGTAVVRYNIGPSRAGFYGRFLELGTRFIGAKPWLEPAIDGARSEMLRKCGKIWGRGVEREMRKLAGAPRRGR